MMNYMMIIGLGRVHMNYARLKWLLFLLCGISFLHLSYMHK